LPNLLTPSTKATHAKKSAVKPCSVDAGLCRSEGGCGQCSCAAVVGMSICPSPAARICKGLALGLPGLFGLLGLVFGPAALAQAAKPLTLKEAAQSAVLNNPEILSRWHTIKAAAGERDVSAGGLLPRVDLLAGTGLENRGATSALPSSRFNRSSASLTLTQLLYDGFVTRNDIKRLDHARLVRLFEFFDASENVALEAARAYYDVLRFRELVRLAEDNFVQHRSVFEQTERRVKAKVARAVDLEQIGARLSLAESNLLTETSNLHDTTARFQRIVGFLPSPEMPPALPLVKNIPIDASAAVREAQQHNGALRAATENVRASSAALASRSGAFRPRFDLRLRRDQAVNLIGVPGSSDATVAEVVMTWNLFNGFSDRARERQFAEQLNVAKDLRDKTCRDIRQTLLIAYNDARKLKEQMGYLDQNKVSVEKARNAYRLQFDIGQRSLLDLLDTENELYQARRSVANAEQDLNLAYARTHAGAGTLLAALELSKIETGSFPELAQWNEGEDAAQHCPAEAVAVYLVDKRVLIDRAVEQVKQTALLNARERAIREVFTPPAAVAPATPASAPASASRPAPLSPTVAPVPAPLPAATPAGSPQPPAATPGAANSSALRLALENQTALLNARERAAQQANRQASAAVAQPADSGAEAAAGEEVKTALEAWRAAWSRRDVQAYVGFYASAFVPATGDREAWREKRMAVMTRAVDISVEVTDLDVATPDASNATATFKQTYRSSGYLDVVTKTLQWVRVGDRWMITREISVMPLAVSQ
jgi:adhesin transport system outer membrane protein